MVKPMMPTVDMEQWALRLNKEIEQLKTDHSRETADLRRQIETMEFDAKAYQSTIDHLKSRAEKAEAERDALIARGDRHG